MCGSRTTSRSRFLTIGTRDRSKPSLEPISKKSPWTNRSTSLSCSVSIATRDVFTGFVYRSGIFYLWVLWFCLVLTAGKPQSNSVSRHWVRAIAHNLHSPTRHDETVLSRRVGRAVWVGYFHDLPSTRTMYTIDVKTFFTFFNFGHVFNVFNVFFIFRTFFI